MHFLGSQRLRASSALGSTIPVFQRWVREPATQSVTGPNHVDERVQADTSPYGARDASFGDFGARF